jgi:hypothetical protein
MPIAFSFFSLIIKRDALSKVIHNSQNLSEEVNNRGMSLLGSEFSDEYLIGIEAMSENLEDEQNLLNSLGLIWNNGIDCVDYFMPSKGAYTASWLKYARLKDGKSYYSCFKYANDFSADIKSFDKELSVKFPQDGVLLNRASWAFVARDELNRLYYPSLNELYFEIKRENRVCPNPIYWNELHEIIIRAAIHQIQEPPLPLILGAWWESSNLDKANRLVELLNWADKNCVSNVAWAYIMALKEVEWHHNS